MKNLRKSLFKATALLLAMILTVSCFASPAQAAFADEEGNEYIVITLDPGHGLNSIDGTGTKVNGKWIWERDVVYQIACEIKSYLESNYWNVRVHLTRNEYENPTHAERVELASKYKSDLCLSIHLNAFDGTDRGSIALVPVGTYRPEQARISKEIAKELLKGLEKLGIRNGGLYTRTCSYRYPDGSPRDSYNMIANGVYYNVPTIIIEECYMDNWADYQAFLSTDEKITNIALNNAAVLADYFDLEPIDMRPDGTPSANEAGDAPFADVRQSAWYYDDVIFVYQNGLMNGTSETLFSPRQTTNRAMVATLLYRMAEATETYDTASFSDVAPGSWYFNSVEWAYANEITTGVGDGKFAPDVPVTREQFVTLLCRYAQWNGLSIASEYDMSNYSDAESISPFAKDAMRWACDSGLIAGYDDGTIKPQNSLSRAELAALIHRYMNVYGNFS